MQQPEEVGLHLLTILWLLAAVVVVAGIQVQLLHQVVAAVQVAIELEQGYQLVLGLITPLLLAVAVLAALWPVKVLLARTLSLAQLHLQKAVVVVLATEMVFQPELPGLMVVLVVAPEVVQAHKLLPLGWVIPLHRHLRQIQTQLRDLTVVLEQT